MLIEQTSQTDSPNVSAMATRRSKREWALSWAARGFHVFPLTPNSKLPLAGSRGHLDATTDPEMICSWWTDVTTGGSTDHNIGLSPRDGRHLIVDLDIKQDRDGPAEYLALGGHLGGLVVRTASGGLHVYCTAENPLRTGAGRLAPGIDTRGADGYVLAPGSTLDGVPYEVIEDGEPLPIPDFIAEKIGTRADRDVPRVGRVLYRHIEDDLAANIDRAVFIVKNHPPAISGTWHELGFRLGAELCRVAVSRETAIELAESHWVPRGTGYASRDRFIADLTGGYEAALKDGEHGRDCVTSVLEAMRSMAVVPDPDALRPQESPPSAYKSAQGGNGEAMPQRFSDDALAMTFSGRHADELRYVPAWAKWLRWDGARWAADDRLGAFDLARAVCREAAAEAACDRDGAALARVLNSAATVAAVERMARGDQRHARPPAEFDSDPWALNTPGGVMDLRTGRLAPHDPAAMHTKIAGATPGGECPRWCNFLRQITQGDDELAGFLQRFAGYTLTGDISEQAFLVAYGPGGNGKGVLFSTLLAVMGDYARTASPQVFTVSRNEQHETNVAALRGARMVAVTETEEGRQWAEARVKAVTGGDTISARVMRGDPFDFRPCCKLWFSGNHRPPLRNPDAAMRRRMHLVPLTYVPAKPDTGLGEALRAELGGIMAWAADGCLAWQRMGLAPPAAVRSATDEYFAAQDVLGEWLAERVERVPRAVAQSADLYAAWSIWATRRGEEAGTQKRFSEAMERCAAKRRTAAGVVFEGVRLRAMVAFDGVNADADTPIQW